MRPSLVIPLVLCTLILSFPRPTLAHCDALDGPVVTDARKALEDGKVDRVLRWIPEDGEEEVRRAFQETLKVRRLGRDARQLADRSFFETLVRIHRAGEGAHYTGLAPAGRDLGPAIPAADRALDSGQQRELEHLLVHALRGGIDERLREARRRRERADESPEKGREFVAAYVDFVHYVKGVHEAVVAHGSHGNHGTHEVEGH